MTHLQTEVTLPLWALLGMGLLFAVTLVYLSPSPKVEEKTSSESAAQLSDSQFKQHGLADAPYKMLLCVNTTLGMGKGKIAAQCGHATLGAYKLSVKHNPSGVRWWETTGCAKIAVKVSEEELSEIEQSAKKQGLITYVVTDAGRTQIAMGSRTVLAIGPAPVREMQFTNHLKLL